MAGWMLSPGGLGVLGGARWPRGSPLAPPERPGGLRTVEVRRISEAAARQSEPPAACGRIGGGVLINTGRAAGGPASLQTRFTSLRSGLLGKKNIHPSPSAPVKSH